MSDQILPFQGLKGSRNDCSKCSIQLLCLPAALNADDFDTLNSIVQKRRPLKRGNLLFTSGQKQSCIYVAREGAFKTVVYNTDGDSHVTGFHLPGEILGLDALGTSFHTCDAIALTTGRCLRNPAGRPGARGQPCARPATPAAEDHRAEHQPRPEAYRDCFPSAMPMSAWRFSCTSCPNAIGMLGRSGDRFMIPMSRDDIGSYLGLVIETVSRTLSKMQDDGLIEVNGREVVILDMAKLNDLAHEVMARKIA